MGPDDNTQNPCQDPESSSNQIRILSYESINETNFLNNDDAPFTRTRTRGKRQKKATELKSSPPKKKLRTMTTVHFRNDISPGPTASLWSVSTVGKQSADQPVSRPQLLQKKSSSRRESGTAQTQNVSTQEDPSLPSQITVTSRTQETTEQDSNSQQRHRMNNRQPQPTQNGGSQEVRQHCPNVTMRVHQLTEANIRPFQMNTKGPTVQQVQQFESNIQEIDRMNKPLLQPTQNTGFRGVGQHCPNVTLPAAQQLSAADLRPTQINDAPQQPFKSPANVQHTTDALLDSRVKLIKQEPQQYQENQLQPVENLIERSSNHQTTELQSQFNNESLISIHSRPLSSLQLCSPSGQFITGDESQFAQAQNTLQHQQALPSPFAIDTTMNHTPVQFTAGDQFQTQQTDITRQYKQEPQSPPLLYSQMFATGTSMHTATPALQFITGAQLQVKQEEPIYPQLFTQQYYAADAPIQASVFQDQFQCAKVQNIAAQTTKTTLLSSQLHLLQLPSDAQIHNPSVQLNYKDVQYKVGFSNAQFILNQTDQRFCLMNGHLVTQHTSSSQESLSEREQQILNERMLSLQVTSEHNYALDWDVQKQVKPPPISAEELIYLAIIHSTTRLVSEADLVEFVTSTFPYFFRTPGNLNLQLWRALNNEDFVVRHTTNENIYLYGLVFPRPVHIYSALKQRNSSELEPYLKKGRKWREVVRGVPYDESESDLLQKSLRRPRKSFPEDPPKAEKKLDAHEERRKRFIEFLHTPLEEKTNFEI